MGRVIHTVDIVYGSYSQDDVDVSCDENDDIDTIKAIIRKKFKLDFLPMATYRVNITNTKYIDDSEDD